MDKAKKQTGVELIAQERKDQIEKHGHTLENDRGEYNMHGELAVAAAYCILNRPCSSPFSWPSNFFIKTSTKVYSSTKTYAEYKIEMLKIAGALIAAEIDRLQEVEE